MEIKFKIYTKSKSAFHITSKTLTFTLKENVESDEERERRRFVIIGNKKQTEKVAKRRK